MTVPGTRSTSIRVGPIRRHGRSEGLEAVRMPTARRRFVRHALVAGAALLSLTLAGTTVMAEEEGEGRTLPVDFVHNNLEDAPIAGAVWAAGPALKDGKAICSV